LTCELLLSILDRRKLSEVNMNRIHSSIVHLAACIAWTLTAAALTPARAQVVSLTVGLNTACPYGVPN